MNFKFIDVNLPVIQVWPAFGFFMPHQFSNIQEDKTHSLSYYNKTACNLNIEMHFNSEDLISNQIPYECLIIYVVKIL